MADNSHRHNSNAELLRELEALSQSLYQSNTTRRTASLTLPCSPTATRTDHRSHSGRMSMSPQPNPDGGDVSRRHHPPSKNQHSSPLIEPTAGEKKGFWNWKPMRALSHIGMQRLGCLLSVEVIAVQGLPASMNGLRLSVHIRKKETKDGAVQTMPSRVLQGSADFEETLFIRCHIYCSGGRSTGKPLKFESRPFIISAVAMDAPELDFGKSTVDLSLLLRESIEKSLDGMGIRQWDTTFKLSGKAKGGELVLKLGFQIMDDGGVGIYNQSESIKSTHHARRQSKSSFSVTSQRVTRSEPSATPWKEVSAVDLKEIDSFSLDEPGPPPSSTPSIQKSEMESEVEDLDLPQFEVVEKGIEIQAEGDREEVEYEESVDERAGSSEVVKEVVHHRAQRIKLIELDSIAKQIKALESPVKTTQANEMQRLDAEEETVTKEFLQMLELEDDDDDDEPKYDAPDLIMQMKSGAGKDRESETRIFLSELGKGVGSVVQTKDGGYLVSMNPFNIEVPRRETPKLAMQISRSFILRDQKMASAFEVFQRLAAMGSEELGSELLSRAAMDELMGKTAEQIAFEGIASVIINGRNREGASSSAARSIAVVKTMATAMGEGRKERILTGIWNMKEDPVIMEEILAISLQKMEAMAVEALKIQAEMTDEEAPFVVSPLIRKEDPNHPLDSAISPEDWAKTFGKDTTVTVSVIIQLRDPQRRYEAVGGPLIAVVQAARVDDGGDEEGRFKVTSLHVGGLKLRSGGKRSTWNGEKQRLTSMQWLVAYGLGKTRKKNKPLQAKVGQDLFWSISSRVMADMWLSHMRNPDVKIP